MERLKTNQKSGITASGLRKFGLLFVILGIVSRSILQNQFLGMSNAGQNLMDTMMNMPDAMQIATLALILQALETCAVPVFCFLLVEGVVHTSNFKQYGIRVLGLAVISEIPYNLAYSAKLLDFSSRNPVFGLVLSMVVIYFYQQYSGMIFKNVLIKILVTVMAIIWANMLKIDHAACCVLIVAALWALREKPVYRNIMGCTAAVVCTMFSMYYLAAPMAFMIMHFYNGEKGQTNRVMDYLSYPVLLFVIGISALFLF